MSDVIQLVCEGQLVYLLVGSYDTSSYRSFVSAHEEKNSLRRLHPSSKKKKKRNQDIGPRGSSGALPAQHGSKAYSSIRWSPPIALLRKRNPLQQAHTGREFFARSSSRSTAGTGTYNARWKSHKSDLSIAVCLGFSDIIK